MRSNDSPARASAEERFKRLQKQRAEAAQAMAEYVAGQRAEEAKTARLRALRLARDAELAANEPAPAPKAKKPRAKRARSS